MRLSLLTKTFIGLVLLVIISNFLMPKTYTGNEIRYIASHVIMMLIFIFLFYSCFSKRPPEKLPPVKFTVFGFLLLAFISTILEGQTYKGLNPEHVTYVFMSYLPASFICALLFRSFFYKMKSTHLWLCCIAFLYFSYIGLTLSIDRSGYSRSYHETIVDGHLTNFGKVGMTFNVFLAPLVLAFNMYILEIFFKKRFLVKQAPQEKQTQT